MQINGFFRNKRAVFVFILMAAFLIAIFVRFICISFIDESKPVTRKVTVERGSIVDRNGKPLAVSTDFYHFGVSPVVLAEPEKFAEIVSPVLGLSAEEITEKINAYKTSNFVYLKKKITQEQCDELKELIPQEFSNAVKYDHLSGRIYPENDLASQLIGYMGDDGTGLSGIEYSEQSVLSPALTGNETGTVFGKNIYLTIDSSLQFKLEKIAQEAMESTQAESIMLLAANAKNGEILSYISLPSVNLNSYSQAETSQKIDRPAVYAYEPGSVFKIFTSAAYLDAGVIKGDQLFLCDGLYSAKTSGGETIRIACLDHHGWVTVREALKYSCNDALAQMSDFMDTDTFLEYIKAFGFGERTDVELPSETRGSVKNKTDAFWSARSKPTMSIGQELSVSALQMVQAATAIANGGVPLQLTFIQRITDHDGNVEYVHQPVYKDRVLKASTANNILSYMETTARSGTGSRASLGDISIGVKTGTAQMADPVHGGYSDTDFISNCIAVFPVENPEIILYIVIEKAKGETYAGRIVAPVIAKAADEIIDHEGMTRASAASLEHSGKVVIMNNAPLSIETIVPDFTGRPKRDLIPLLNRTDINLQINGEGWVVSQNPPAGTPVTENMTIELNLE